MNTKIKRTIRHDPGRLYCAWCDGLIPKEGEASATLHSPTEDRGCVHVITCSDACTAQIIQADLAGVL